jgi:broad specificity phosphatase PhoE
MQQQFPEAVLPDEITERGWWLRGYEEMEECEERAGVVAGRLRSMAATDPEMHLAIVTHGTFINQLLHQLVGVPSDSMMYFSHANTGITRIEFAVDGFHVLRYVNRVPHLDAGLMTR